VVKVIIETGKLNEKEKKRACHLIRAAGAKYVKTCTGFAEGSATVEDVRLLKEAGHGQLFVKASAGVKTLAQANALIFAGASRIGASRGIAILKEEKELKDALGDTGRKVLQYLVKHDPQYAELESRIRNVKNHVLFEIQDDHDNREHVYYLAGPVNANEKHGFHENMDIMEATAAKLEEEGCSLIVPGQIERGILINGKPLPQYGLNYFLFMNEKDGLWPSIIRKCDGIKFCNDWKYSKGAGDEYYIAEKSGLRIG
jgi:hypothetical protein